MKRPLALALLSAAAMTTMAAPTLARTGPIADFTVRSVAVEIGDLDLATAEGQRKLQTRVDRAVRQACRVTDPQSGRRAFNPDARNCLANARAHANRQVAALLGDSQRGG